MKLSDYVADFLAGQGVTHVFGLTGGAVVHLFDSVARHPKMQPIFTHHEQAAAFAAEGYARIRNGLGAAMVTTGPGGTNTITGVVSAWLDSIPCIFISGQVRLGLTGRGYKVRQVGPQHLDIISIVTSITKYSVMIDDINKIKYELQKAAHIALSGRPGPVWIDLPLDMQWSSIDPEKLPSFDPAELDSPSKSACDTSAIKQVVQLLAEARRPVILAGYGVKLARAEAEFKQLVEKLRIPFLTTWNVIDLMATDHPLNAGRPGMFGQRGSNLAMQNCDLVLSIGSHLSVSLTAMRFNDFARAAKVVMVDIDQGELDHRTVRVDLPIACDARVFLQTLLREIDDTPLKIDEWRSKTLDYKTAYNGFPPSWLDRKDFVNPYVFMDRLSDDLAADDIIVIDGGGTVDQVGFQGLRIKEGQRLFASVGLGPMGSGLPESIGACFAGNRRRTICLCGDGSLQLNIHELQTIVHHQLPVKIFILNNDGYTSIRQTQDGFLDGNHVGSEKEGGISLPDYMKVAQAYGLKSVRIHHHGELNKIQEVLDDPGPVVCEIMVSKDDQPLPRQGFEKHPDGTNVPRPLEDMYPYLDREEFRKAMIVEPVAN